MSLLARVAFAALLAATVAAFFVAQRLKAQPSVINSVQVIRYFSPNADGERDMQEISFQLKEADDVTVDIVDDEDGRVARVATARPAQPFRPVRLRWDGRTDEGARAPDGLYRVRIGLRRQGRSVVYPTSFSLDTAPPTPAAIIDEGLHVVSPGQPVPFRITGAGRRAVPTFQVVRTDVSPAEVVRSFEGERRARRATWDGLTDDGRPVEPGIYVVAVSARDRAGNLGTGPAIPPVAGDVEGRPGFTVRGLSVQPPVAPVQAGQDVSFLVDARGQSYRWQVRRIGEPRPRKRSEDRKTRPTLQFKAPGGKSGVYLLEVRSGRYQARVPFAVQGARRARVLVVLPLIAWLGRDRVDDPREPDGVPNTLLAPGTPVRYPRMLVGDEGLPSGFARDVGPLLAFLDRARVSYDLTTDLALSRSRDPRATDREGVLFAGSPTWVTRGLARRLRRYVTDGGRVALLGPNSLRGGVSLTRDRLSRPTPPGPTDALGARIADPRRLPALPEGRPAPLSTLDEATGIGVLEGFDATLDAPFETVEELISPGTRAELVASVGQALTDQEIADAEAANRPPREERAALSTTRLGRGFVFRVGVPGWVERLSEDDAEVEQITRNIVDLLRRVRPRPRSPIG